jgi:hypothetical protein
MKEKAIKMVEQMTAEGAILQLHSPSGQHDIDDIEVIEAIQYVKDEDIRISGTTIIFGNGEVSITIEDQDDYNADASNHVTGE